MTATLNAISNSLNTDIRDLSFGKTLSNGNKVTSGLIYKGDIPLFFKVQNHNQFFNESNFRRLYSKIFPSPKIISSNNHLKENIVIYEFCDAEKDCAYRMLRDDSVDIEERSSKLELFYERLWHIYDSHCNVQKYNDDYPSSCYFEKRVHLRLKNFYDTSVLDNNNPYNTILADSINIISNYIPPQRSVYTLTHGDLHDLNYSYNWVFWDLDSAGINPLFAEISIIAWYVLFQETLIPRYKENYFRFCTGSKTEELNPILQKKRTDCLQKLLEKCFSRIPQELQEDMKKEFAFRLLCRALLIDNIYDYNINDFRTILSACKLITLFYKDIASCPTSLLRDLQSINYTANKD